LGRGLDAKIKLNVPMDIKLIQAKLGLTALILLPGAIQMIIL